MSEPSRHSRRLRRREWLALIGGGAAALGAVGPRLLWKWSEGLQRASTFVGRVEDYDAVRLSDLVGRGLRELGFERRKVTGRSVLLKPNLVEPRAEAPHINTHPVVVRAVAEVFRRLGARQVAVAEGPGHVRDTRLVLDESGFGSMLAEAGLPFFDLNLDEVEEVRNRARFSSLSSLYLPRTLRRFDLVVSLAKLKTHHWAGVTLSLKNLFGVMPGMIYGWPKNALHAAGLQPAILDIAAAVQPALAIVDGVVGMEGDGPIMGQPRRAGLLVMGTNLVAVDATATRLMGLEPRRIEYLAVAAGRFGPIRASHIEQRGEPLARLRQSFRPGRSVRDGAA